MRSSILKRLCGPLCDAVMNSRGQAQPLLERLHQANLFLVPLDDEGAWYRFHPLFAEALQHRLHEAEPAAVADLHARASVWYEQAGLLATRSTTACAWPITHALPSCWRGRGPLAQVRSDKALALQMDWQSAELLADSSLGEAQIAVTFEALTERELDVLRLLAKGFSNRAIAEHLVVSVGTVKSHLKHIFGKLAVESRTQAVAQARAAGLL